MSSLSPVTTWLLAGALAASLVWNFRDAAQVAPSAGTACVREESSAGASGAASSCASALDATSLGLDETQERELAAWTSGACAEACEADRDARAALERLNGALRDPGTSPERLRALAAEVSRARAASLDACVDAIVAVRRVLSREQLCALLERCCSRGACGE